jgi:NADPH-dependent glutamate synthase beta subunit-like oxidoreductase
LDRVAAHGGAAQSVIPPERLPETLMRREIADVLASYGDRVTLCQQALDGQNKVSDLLAHGHQAVLLAPGLGKSATALQGPRPTAGVEGALEFLARMKSGGRVSGTVLVLGGGNTAIDAALAALKAGAQDSLIIYRRSFAEMPAWPQERDAAIRAGVALITLTAPLEYVADRTGKMTGLKVLRTRLGPLDAKGRRSPQPIPGTEHVLPADLVIEAFGQQMDAPLKQALGDLRLTDQGLIWTRPGTFQTSQPGVFAAGDAINGGTTVVQAVAEGGRAALELDAWLGEQGRD